jgi:hypothetical protein
MVYISASELIEFFIINVIFFYRKEFGWEPGCLGIVANWQTSDFSESVHV